MLKLLFGRSRRSKEFNDGYITIMYLKKDHGVIIHDSLTLPTSPLYTEEMGDTESKPEYIFDHDHMMSMVNPATGLPMIDGMIDVDGNLFGHGGD